MSHSSRKFWLPIVILACGLTGAVPSQDTVQQATGDPVDNLILTVKIPRASYQYGETVLLQATLKNVGNTAFQMKKAPLPEMFSVIVLMPRHGKEAPLSLYGKQQTQKTAFFEHVIVLAPQEEYTATLELNRYFDMTLPGKFHIYVSKNISLPDGRKATVSAPPLTVSVRSK